MTRTVLILALLLSGCAGTQDPLRRAYGEEPGDIFAVGLMTDPGDNYSRRRTFCGDITFRSGKK
jgi:hypothetical protein